MQIRNGIVLNGTNDRFERLDLRIENGNISQFGVFPPDGEDFDASGCYVIPGFIDTHIHGGVGVEFASASGDFSKARRWLVSEGITTIAPTVRANPKKDIVNALKNIKIESEKNVGAKIGGIHIEGPFVSRERCGAMTFHDYGPDETTLQSFFEASGGLLKIMTFAPERPDVSCLYDAASRLGVTLSMGHSNATYGQAMEAFKKGATRVTHLFNAMRGFSHRDTGLPGAALTEDGLNCELICDFVHLAPETVSLVLRAKSEKGITLISDNGFMSGLGDGVYEVDNRIRTVKNGVCLNSQGTIAGSCVSMHKGAKNLLSLGVPLEKISVMASKNPAKALGLDSVTGSIACGKKADVLICDNKLDIKAVFVNGVRQV